MDQAEQLRNMVRQNGQEVPKRARVITVTSGKGGVGKSNVAINLAVELRKLGQRVVIFDADFGLANIEVMFGAVPKHNLSDLIHGRKSLQEIITWGPMEVGFISGGCGVAELSNLSREQIGEMVRSLAALDEMADVVIVDTGAGISGQVLDFLVASGEVLLVTTPEPTSITDSYSLLKALSRNPAFHPDRTVIKMVANKVDSARDGDILYQKLNAVVARYLRIPFGFLGIVPLDMKLNRAVMQQNPICIQDPTAKSAKAFAYLAAALMNRKPETAGRTGMSGFFAGLLGSRRTSGQS